MKRRITVTLEDDVLQCINEEAVANSRTFDDVLNERLRRCYPAKKSAWKIKRFIVRPLNTGGFAPDTNENKLNQLFDALESEKHQK